MAHSNCTLCGEICYEYDKDSLFNISQERWDTVKAKAQLWKGLDKFGDVFHTVDWDNGPSGKCMHDSCRLLIVTKRKLEQAIKRKDKLDKQIIQDSMEASTSSQSETEAPSKKLRSSFGALGVHMKEKCVWCMRGQDSKHPGNPLQLMQYDHAWAAFKRHTVILQDQDMKDRINCLIESVNDDPFAAEIRYHEKCWLKYVRTFQKMTDDRKLPLQNVTLREAQTEFFHHIQSVIFVEHELRSLQSLLSDYKKIISRYGFPTDGVKSSYIKDVLQREFKDKIGFHARPQRNVSELVYDTSAGGSYIEAVLTYIGVSSEQLVSNLSKRIINDVKATGTVPWPPSVDELEEPEELSPLLLKLVSSLSGKSEIDLSSKVLSLTSFLTQHILGQPTKTSINASVTLHGITRSKELVENNARLGLGIPYQKVLILRDTWALRDLQGDYKCPAEIAEGKPGISIIDNDDFKNDTLTGGGTSHRTNWMMIQKEVLYTYEFILTMHWCFHFIFAFITKVISIYLLT